MNKTLSFATIAIITLFVIGCNSSTDNTKRTDNKNTVETVPEAIRETALDQDKIMQAALEGEITTVQDALNNGFDVNTTDANKRTLLMLAAYNGHNQIIELLVANGADVNLRDTINRTALMFASTGPFVSTVQSLLQSGAQPNLTDDQENWTAAMMAAAEGQLEVLKVLVAHGADLKMVDVDGESSLDFAKANGHTQVADYIASQIK